MWVQKERVPYQCGGVERGVWFTAEDIRAIGHKLPDLMGGRRRSGAVDAPPDPESSAAGAAPTGLEPTADTIAAWAQLKAFRPVPGAPRTPR
jgi:hypothetical protein